MYAPEINDFVYITDNAYSAAEIRKTELRLVLISSILCLFLYLFLFFFSRILQVLNFGINRPLPLHFLRRFSKVLLFGSGF